MFDSDNYNPFTANNSYSIVSKNIKNEENCEITKNTITKVYTQNFEIKHEDLHSMVGSTLSNLTNIKKNNPNIIFTSQIIIPPNQTIWSGHSRLLENSLNGISSNIDVIIFGGTVNSGTYNYKEKEEPLDLSYTIERIISFKSNIRFSHFGTKENYDKLLEIKDYALLKNDVTKSCKILDDINNTYDNTRYEYDLRYLCKIIFNMILDKNSSNKRFNKVELLNRIELLVQYKLVDVDNFTSFKEMIKKFGYRVILESNKFIVEKN